MRRPGKLGLLPLVASTFFMVSGGAYGLEDLVACGYGVAVAALLATPLLWSLPTALMVGELASALPHEGGYYAWVRRALGPFWGFQEAWLSLVASVFDMAIYPTLFTLYLGYLFPSISTGGGAWFIGGLVIAVCTAWNLRGAAPIGIGSVALAIAVQAPFAALAVLAMCHAPSAGAVHSHSETGRSGLLVGLLVAMWNFMGWDNASTIAEEVQRPERTYPRAVLATLGIVTLTYVLPVWAASAAGLDPARWSTGAWVTAAREVGGGGLAWAVTLGGMVCGVGMYSALLLSYSRLPAVLAADGYLPGWLAIRDRKTGAPWAAVVVCSAVYMACLGIGFSRLVELDVIFYGASLVLEFVALVTLRVREPGLMRPFRVPGGAISAALWGLPPVVLLGVALWHGRAERLGPLSSLSFSVLLAGLGPVVYAVRRPRISTSTAPP